MRQIITRLTRLATSSAALHSYNIVYVYLWFMRER